MAVGVTEQRRFDAALQGARMVFLRDGFKLAADRFAELRRADILARLIFGNASHPARYGKTRPECA